MVRIVLLALLVALTSAAEASPRHRQAPKSCDRLCRNFGISFPLDIRPINVKTHRETITHRVITHPAESYGAPSPSLSFTGDSLVERARSYMGQTARQIGVRSTLWCSAFLRHITGAAGVDDSAISWDSRPHVLPAIGTIAVMRHHVGVVSGFDSSGNPIIVSGNSAHRVREGAVSRQRIISFVNAD